MKSFAQDSIGPRQVALSFDDGPDPVHTPKLLDILAKHDIKAIFFVLGKNLVRPSAKEILRRMSREGHFVGNHAYTHSDLTKLTEAKIKSEIIRTADLIGDADRGVKLFRPPYGAHNQLVDHLAQSLGYQSLFWDIDILDWHPKLWSGDWVRQCLDQLENQAQAVVLAHDIHATTVAKMGEFAAAMTQIPDLHISVSLQSLGMHLASVRPVWGAGPSPWMTARCIFQDLYRAIMPIPCGQEAKNRS